MSNTKNLFIYSFAAILVLASFIRVYSLDQFPPQLNRDEAALALNALYIHQAGYDEWDQKLPLQFKSFGDYKLPGYVYILSTFFQLHISDIVVRLPSALAGICLLAVSTLWVKNLLPEKAEKTQLLFFLVSISFSPFAIYYSRMAWEANVALTFMLSALYFLHTHKPRLWKDFLAVIFFLLASITYNAPFLLLPFFMLSLPFLRGLKSIKRWVFAVLALSVLFVSLFILFNTNNAQKSGILFFNDPSIVANYPSYRQNLPPLLRVFAGSKYAYFTLIATDHYFKTFLPSFLVVHGGQHPWHSILGRGHLFWSTYVFFVIGFFLTLIDVVGGLIALRQKKTVDLHKYVPSILLLFLLIISPLAAVFTTDAPHATRSLFAFVMIIVFSMLGFDALLELAKKYSDRLKYGVLSLAIVALLLESSFYLYQYFILWPHNFSPDFQLGVIPILQQTAKSNSEGNILIIDHDWYLYVITAWYLRLPYNEFRTSVHRTGPDVAGLYQVSQVGRYYFQYDDHQLIPDQQAIISKDSVSGLWKVQ